MPLESQANSDQINYGHKETLGSFIMKIIFYSIQLLFFSIGICLIGLYIWLRYVSSQSSELISSSTAEVYNGLLIVGICLSSITISAIHVVRKNCRFLSMLYIIFLILVLAIEGFIFFKIPGAVEIAKNEIKEAWDAISDEGKKAIESKFNCCGFTGPEGDQNCSNGEVPGCATSLIAWLDLIDSERLVGFSIIGGLQIILILATIGLVYL